MSQKEHTSPLFINLHWLHIAARIKLKALMFAYKTTTGFAPLDLNSLLQNYVPSRSLHSESEQRIIVSIPKRHRITFTDFFINCSLLMEWPAFETKGAPSLRILRIANISSPQDQAALLFGLCSLLTYLVLWPCCHKISPPAHSAFGSSFETMTTFYDGIMWTNTALAEENQCLLRHLTFDFTTWIPEMLGRFFFKFE